MRANRICPNIEALSSDSREMAGFRVTLSGWIQDVPPGVFAQGRDRHTSAGTAPLEPEESHRRWAWRRSGLTEEPSTLADNQQLHRRTRRCYTDPLRYRSGDYRNGRERSFARYDEEPEVYGFRRLSYQRRLHSLQISETSTRNRAPPCTAQLLGTRVPRRIDYLGERDSRLAIYFIQFNPR